MFVFFLPFVLFLIWLFVMLVVSTLAAAADKYIQMTLTLARIFLKWT